MSVDGNLVVIKLFSYPVSEQSLVPFSIILSLEAIGFITRNAKIKK